MPVLEVTRNKKNAALDGRGTLDFVLRTATPLTQEQRNVPYHISRPARKHLV